MDLQKVFLMVTCIIFLSGNQISNAADKNEYEREIDVYNFNEKIDWNHMLIAAKKLQEMDPQNVAAFRAEVLYYCNRDETQKAIDYCKQTIQKKMSPNLSIEAYTQLGNIYCNHYHNEIGARKFIDQAITLVKKQYTKAEIEKLVNGTDVHLHDLELVGHSNTIRELYVLKSYIENCNPEGIDSTSTMMDLELMEDSIHIKYPTNW